MNYKRPIFNSEKELHPILDFDDHTYYLGFLLETVVKERKKKIIFVKTENGLTAIDEMARTFRDVKIGDMHLRISPELLTTGGFQKRFKELGLEGKNKRGILKETFNFIKSIYKRYQDFSEEEIYDFLAVWDIGTYFHPIFYSYPYVFIHGLMGTGKTKNLDIGRQICFNGMFLGNMRESPLFRSIESLRPTLFIDETDVLASKKDRGEIRELLLNGYKKGGVVPRSEKSHAMSTTFTPKFFHVYCPKRLANIEGFEQVLASRAVKITMWRTKSDKYSEEINEFDPMWQKARDLCYLTLFSNWSAVKNKYENFYREEGIINRNWELWKPILVIASLLGKETYEKIVKFAKKRMKEVEETMNVEAPEYKLVKAMFRITGGKTSGWYCQRDIKELLLNEFEEGEGTWITAFQVTKMMERLGVKRVRMYLGRKQYYLDIGFIHELLERFNIKVEDIKPIKEKKIKNLPMKVYDYIKTKSSVQIQDVRTYFNNMGIEESDLDNAVEKLKNQQLIFEPTVGVLKRV